MYPTNWFYGLALAGAGAVQALPADRVGQAAANSMVPFECTSAAFIAQGTGVQEVNLATGLKTRDVISKSKGAGDYVPISGFGYNPKDNLLYGFYLKADGTSQLVQIDKNGQTKLPGFSLPYIVSPGDFDSRGNLWVSERYKQDRWAKIDLIPGSSTWGQIVAEGNVTAPPFFVNDWVYALDAGEYMWAVGKNSTGVTNVYAFCLRAHEWLQIPSYAHQDEDDKHHWTASFSNGDEVVLYDFDGALATINPSNQRKMIRTFGPGEAFSFPNINGGRCLNAPTL